MATTPPAKSGNQVTSVNPVSDAANTETADVNTPSESKNASILVKPGWPITTFKVEGIPVINTDGTMLTAQQLKTVEMAAEAQNFDLIVEKNDGEVK